MTDFFENLLSNGELQEKVAELKAYKDVNEDFKTAWEELKAENDKLKEENKTLEQFLSKEPLALQALQKGYASYKKSTDVFYEMVKEYKQTLQEIKKICKMDCGDCQYNQDCDCNFEECEEAKIDDILDLITKAEEE